MEINLTYSTIYQRNCSIELYKPVLHDYDRLLIATKMWEIWQCRIFKAVAILNNKNRLSVSRHYQYLASVDISHRHFIRF